MASTTSRRRRQVLHCQFCPNTYHKREHLVRHERIHTGLRPYSCDKCDRTFARHDSLLRHERVHNPKIRLSPPRPMKFSGMESQQSAPQSPDPNHSLSSMANSIASQPQGGTSSSAASADLSTLGFNKGPFFAETEDFFQYLLSTPAGWPTTLPTDITTPVSLPGSRNTGNFAGVSQQINSFDSGSPQAVQQVGAMITEMVGAEPRFTV